MHEPTPSAPAPQDTPAALAAELRDARAEAHSRAALLARVSHDIRTPANAIWGLSRELLDGGLVPEARETAQGIVSAAGTLLALVSELLDYGSLENGRLQLWPAPFSIRECLEDALEIVALNARAKGLDLEAEVLGEVPEQLRGDAVRLRQILINLLQNAIKYTHFGSVSARIAAESLGPERTLLRLEVADTGMGMSRQACERLFQPYAREGNSRHVEGTGLGLWICKELVELQGGRISVDSRPRKGTRFRVSLPMERERAQPPAVADGAGEAVLEDCRVAVFESRDLPRAALCRELLRAGATAAAFANRPPAAALAGFDLLVVGLDEKALQLERFRSLLPALAMEAPCPLLVLAPRDPPELNDTLAALPGSRLLLKPLRAAALQRTVAELTGRPAFPLSAARAAGRPAPLRWRVLLVEDNAVNQLYMSRLLGARGVEVCLAGTGEQALDLATGQDFDLVLTDLQLPGIDGARTTATLRSMPRSLHTPVLALTADVSPHSRARLLEAGADAVLTKPLEPERFWHLAQQLVEAAARAPAACGRAPSPAPPAGPAAAVHPAPAGDGGPELPDLDRAEALRRAGGSAGAAAELLNCFITTLDTALVELRAATETGRLPQAAAAAHGIAGGAIYCGALRLRQLAERIQEHARAGEHAALPALVEALDGAVGRLRGLAAQSPDGSS